MMKHLSLQRSFFGHVTTRLMKNGKLFKAENIFLKSLHLLRKRSKIPLSHLILKLLVNICPVLEVKSIRRGGGVFRVPFPLSKKRQFFLGLSWLIQETRKRSGLSFPIVFSRELLEASRGRGSTVRKRRSNHKLARASRAFAHFRWR
jgi:small subunit ribosomal protein S7